MQLASIAHRPPHLILALKALSQRENQQAALELIEELSGITVLVAQKFTNDKTAEGLLEAFNLTMGCISLGLSQANIPDGDEPKLSFLLHHGAEHVFQMGFRHIKELSSLPYVPFVSDFDRDPFILQRNVKALFFEICNADPALTWAGDTIYHNEFQDRQSNQLIVECAKWLRVKHFNGPIKDSDLDANAVISIAVIFAIRGDGRIVARTGQREIESLVNYVRKTTPDIDDGWLLLLKQVPGEYQPVLQERMESLRNTLVKKILSKTKIKTVVTEIQDYHAGNELDVEYP